jgi:hypothetical protein
VIDGSATDAVRGGVAALAGPAARRPLPPWTLTAAAGAVAAVGFGVLAGSPRPLVLMAWAVVATCVAGVAVEWGRGRIISLDVMVYAFSGLTFGARPLFLAAHAGELGSWDPAHTAQQYLGNFRAQEIVEFLSGRYPGDVGALLVSAETIGVVFLACFVIARISAARVRSAAPGARLFPRAPAEAHVTAMIAGLALIGLAGQAYVISSVGGIGQALANLETQLTLRQSFLAFVLANCAVVACLLWAAFGHLRGLAGLLFSALLLETVVFAALTGSRTRTFLPVMGVAIVVHLCRRRFRVREALAAILVAAMFAGMFLTLRQVSSDRPLSEAVTSGLSNGASLQVLANDHATFDALVMMDAIVPERIGHQDGRRMAAGFAAVLPSAIFPEKPQQGDVWLRQQLWGDSRQAGRPYTFPGELWLDFAWPGLVIGALGLGFLCARLRQPDRLTSPGQALVAGVVGIAMWELLGGTWSAGTGSLIEYGLPLGLAAVIARRAAPA